MTLPSKPSCTLISSNGKLSALRLVAGCRNPFLPDSDISISGVEMPTMSSLYYLPEMPVFAADFPAGSPGNYSNYMVRVNFRIINRVGVSLSSVNMVFTDTAGNLVTSYATSGGKTVKLMTRLEPADMSVANYPGGAVIGIDFLVLDRRVVETLNDPNLQPKYLYCTLTFRGEDDNGYDVKLTTQFSIKGYHFL